MKDLYKFQDGGFFPKELFLHIRSARLYEIRRKKRLCDDCGGDYFINGCKCPLNKVMKINKQKTCKKNI